MKSLEHKKTNTAQENTQKSAVQTKNNPFLSGNENTTNPFVGKSNPAQLKRKDDDSAEVPPSTMSDVSSVLEEK